MSMAAPTDTHPDITLRETCGYRYPMTLKRGILCLEGNWSHNGDLNDARSVEQPLRMLESAEMCGKVIHRDVATRDEFEHYLKEWLKKKYERYALAYLAFHGTSGTLAIGTSVLTLEELADIIGPGKAQDRILHFGSCSTLAMPDVRLKAFCQKTGAKAIVGYTRQIDWLESTAFDTMLLPRLLDATHIKPVFTSLEREHPRFVRRLGLRIATSKWATDRKIAAPLPPSLAA